MCPVYKGKSNRVNCICNACFIFLPAIFGKVETVDGDVHVVSGLVLDSLWNIG